MSRRWLVAVLLVAAAVLFGIGTSHEAAERSEHGGDPHGEREQILGFDATSPTVIGTGIVLSLVAAAAIDSSLAAQLPTASLRSPPGSRCSTWPRRSTGYAKASPPSGCWR